jgi:hypothetical protein
VFPVRSYCAAIFAPLRLDGGPEGAQTMSRDAAGRSLNKGRSIGDARLYRAGGVYPRQERSHTPMHIKEIRWIAEQLSQSDALCLQRVADQLYERGLKLELLRAAIPPQGEPDIKAARQVLHALET